MSKNCENPEAIKHNGDINHIMFRCLANGCGIDTPAIFEYIVNMPRPIPNLL